MSKLRIRRMKMNYKELDTQKIKNYILSHPEGVLVDGIIAHSGADKLRVYPALFELEQEGWLEVTEREELGAAKKVRIMVNDLLSTCQLKNSET